MRWERLNEFAILHQINPEGYETRFYISEINVSSTEWSIFNAVNFKTKRWQERKETKSIKWTLEKITWKLSSYVWKSSHSSRL